MTLKLNKNPAIAVKRFLFLSYVRLEKFSIELKSISAHLTIPFLFVFWIITFVNVLNINAYIASGCYFSRELASCETISNPASSPENKA